MQKQICNDTAANTDDKQQHFIRKRCKLHIFECQEMRYQNRIHRHCTVPAHKLTEQNKQKQIKPKSILKKKLCKKKNDMNISKSIISVLTIDSTLFNNEKDYKKYQKLTTNDDLPIIQGILCELGDNKK